MRPHLSNPLSQRRGAATNRPHEYMIDGETVTRQQIVERTGLKYDQAAYKLRKIRAGKIPNTWAAIKA